MVGLEPVTAEGTDRRFEDHGQHGGERQRKNDLAHRGQRKDHDDRRRHKPHEAPGPDSKFRNPAQKHRAATWPGWRAQLLSHREPSCSHSFDVRFQNPPIESGKAER